MTSANELVLMLDDDDCKHVQSEAYPAAKKACYLLCLLCILLLVVDNFLTRFQASPSIVHATPEHELPPPDDYAPINLDNQFEAKFAPMKFYVLDPASQIDESVFKMFIGSTCDEIFSKWRNASSSGAPPKPPKLPPSNLFMQFTMFGRIKLKEYYVNEQAVPKKLIWDTIDEQLNMTREQVVARAEYMRRGDVLYEAMDRFKHAIKGKDGAVIGSRNPWVEVFAFQHEARSILTVEYQELDIRSSRNISYIHPNDFAANWRNYSEAFDFVASFSSLEHSGLGRYGDALDPWGDVREVAKIRCVLKPGGIFFLAIPIDSDTLFWNAHRMYGVVRLPWLLKGFKLLGAVMNKNKEDNTPVYAPGIPLEYVLQPPADDAWIWRQPALILQKV